MVASSIFLDCAGREIEASVDEMDATNKTVDASIDGMDATIGKGNASDKNGK